MSPDELHDEFEEFDEENTGRKKFDFTKLLEENKVSVFLALLGLSLAGFGVVVYKSNSVPASSNVEVLNSATESQENDFEIVVEIGGAIKNPGVYKLKNGDRIENLLTASGGLSKDADTIWVEKYINRAAKLSDGQKIYIFSANEQTDGSSANILGDFSGSAGTSDGGYQNFVNINTADFKTLDSLPGIGQVYGQSIIEHRPYSNIEELVTKDVVPQATYEKIKDLVTVY